MKDGNGCESAEVSKTVTVNALPTASIDGDAAVCQNGTLTLTGSGAANYSWNGGAYSTTATYSVNTASASTPTITLKVKDGNGCESAEESKTVTVNALPNASITGDAAVCQNGTLTLNGGTGSTYSWNGGAFAATSTFEVNTATAGPQHITLIAKSAAGCESAVVSKDITVNALPTASIDGDAAVCQNGTLTLTGSGAANYSWNGGAYSTTATYSVNTASASTPTITLKVKDGNGCESAEVSKTVTVNALPTASIDGDAAVCQNGTLTLTGSGAANYSWNGGAYSTTATYSVNTASASTPTITLKVKDGNGCESAEVSKTVTVNALPTAGANITANTHCSAPYDGQYEITATGGSGSGYTYSNDGTNFSATTVYSNLKTATVTVYVKDGNECVSAGFAVVVDDNSANLTKFNVTGGGAYCVGSTAPSVGVDGSEDGMIYTLLNGTAEVGTLTGNGSALNFGPQTEPGTYTVSVEEAGTGCGTTMTGSVTVTRNTLPTATLSAGDKLCTGADLTLTAGGGTSFSWNEAAYTTTATYSVPNTSAGNQHITLKVKDDNGCESALLERDVMVTQQPEFLSLQTPECTLDKLKYTAEITVNVLVDNIHYNLQTEHGTSTTIGTTVQVEADKDNNVEMTLTSIDNAACVATFTITAPDCSCGVIDAPVAANVAVCQGDNTTLSASATLVANEEIRWYDAATGGTLLQTGASYTPTVANTYYVQVVNTVDACTSARVPVTLTIHDLPTLQVTTQPTAVCAPNTVNLLTAMFDQSTNLTYYESDGTTLVANTSAVGAGDYKVTYTDANNCVSAPVTVTAVVNPLPTAFNVTGGGEYCDGGTGVEVGLSGSQMGVTYTLFFQGFQIDLPKAGTGSAMSYAGQTSQGTYTIKAVNDATTCETMMNGSVQVAINPNPTLTLTPSATEITCAEPTVVLTANATNVSYAWTGGSTGATLSVTEAGTYQVTATDLTTGCQSTESVDIAYNGGDNLEASLSANVDATVAVGASLELTLTVTGGTLVGTEWYLEDRLLNSGTDLTFTDKPYLTHTYHVKAIGECNTLEFDKTIEVVWPTVITPYNVAGKNDSFLTSIEDELNMIIYDRFGDKIYEGSHGWDGTRKGKLVSPGVYFYHVVLPNGETVRGTIEVYRQ